MESSPLSSVEKRVLRWIVQFRAARAMRVSRALGIGHRRAERALLSLVERNLVRCEEVRTANAPFAPRLCGRKFVVCPWAR